MKQIIKFCIFALCVCNVLGDTCVVSDIPPDPRSKCCGRHLAAEHVRHGNSSNRTTCTGVLISSRFILTAAQCGMQQREPTSVRLGEYNKTNTGPDCIMERGTKKCADRVMTVQIDFMVAHPNFSRQSIRGNDIALIKLKDPVPYTEFVRPICLPTFDVNTSPSKDLRFIVAGWGSKPSHLQEDDVVKHYVEIPHKSLQSCKAAYEGHGVHRKFQITQNQICAGGEKDKDSCRGDGGGPLMYEKDGQHTSVGIVSYGPSVCGSVGIPSVYTNVYKYLPWINTMKNA
ncbi:unnamed protein product [Leptidea sinapis]|uniref:Peptidase S1 domain-containing protein n=1 Tax=Leptidea sinapis TaxID=189913 RepID=A0A5E4QA76_9NEOP|nr:unnamed protein product [Leptidea sinapis]